jgi:hypothetical protein
MRAKDGTEGHVSEKVEIAAADPDSDARYDGEPGKDKGGKAADGSSEQAAREGGEQDRQTQVHSGTSSSSVICRYLEQERRGLWASYGRVVQIALPRNSSDAQSSFL